MNVPGRWRVAVLLAVGVCFAQFPGVVSASPVPRLVPGDLYTITVAGSGTAAVFGATQGVVTAGRPLTFRAKSQRAFIAHYGSAAVSVTRGAVLKAVHPRRPTMGPGQ